MQQNNKKRQSHHTKLILIFVAIALACGIYSLASASSTVTEQEVQTQTYYEQTCLQLHHSTQRVKNAEIMFDASTDDHIKSSYWDEYQIAREDHEALRQAHLANIAFQSAAGNLPPTSNICVM